MPRNDPTKVVRLPARLVDRYERLAAEQGTTAAGLIAARLEPPAGPRAPGATGRCECKTPVLSKSASNLCTTCGLVR